jgi:hypothetical protein
MDGFDGIDESVVVEKDRMRLESDVEMLRDGELSDAREAVQQY